MRYVRMLHVLFLAILIACDVLFNSVTQALFSNQFYLVFTLSYTGLLLLSRTESSRNIIIQAALLSLWLDLNHIGSFPIFFISYMVSALVIQKLSQYLDSTSFHFLMLVIIGIFLKDLIMYVLLVTLKQHMESYIHFFAYHTLWAIVLNILCLPIVIRLYRETHRRILQLTQERYMR